MLGSGAIAAHPRGPAFHLPSIGTPPTLQYQIYVDDLGSRRKGANTTSQSGINFAQIGGLLSGVGALGDLWR